MALINLYFAWAWLLTGMLSGAVIGLFFAGPDWLGGYSAWPRRMTRLAHVAFLGTGLLNLSFALSLGHLGWTGGALLSAASVLLIVGAATMPLVCFAAAWRPGFRHLFFIPVLCLTGGVGAFLLRGIMP